MTQQIAELSMIFNADLDEQKLIVSKLDRSNFGIGGTCGYFKFRICDLTYYGQLSDW